METFDSLGAKSNNTNRDCFLRCKFAVFPWHLGGRCNWAQPSFSSAKTLSHLSQAQNIDLNVLVPVVFRAPAPASSRKAKQVLRQRVRAARSTGKTKGPNNNVIVFRSVFISGASYASARPCFVDENRFSLYCPQLPGNLLQNADKRQNDIKLPLFRQF